AGIDFSLFTTIIEEYFCIEDTIYQVINNHLVDADVVRFGKGLEQVVCKRSARLHLLDFDGNCLRFEPADDDGKSAAPGHLAKHKFIGTRLGLAVRQTDDI